jgi:hypothetical protein
MPEPIINIQGSQVTMPRLSPLENELTETLSSLRQNTQYIHNSVIYKIDFDEYDRRVSMGRNFYYHAQLDYEYQQITREQFEEIESLYLNDVYTYYLIDSDGKECGKFNTKTREYTLFLKRIIIQENVYYCDCDNHVYTYSGSCIGILSNDNVEIIRFNS